MAKEKKALTGTDLWEALDGKKESVQEVVEVRFGDVIGEITVVFRDADEIQKIEAEYMEKMPQKPKVDFKGIGRIEVPNDEYPQFNDHKLAKEWEEEVEPLRKEKIYRTAVEFIHADELPCEDKNEAAEILSKRLRFMDAVKIVNKGMELAGFDRQLDEARKNS